MIDSCNKISYSLKLKIMNLNYNLLFGNAIRSLRSAGMHLAFKALAAVTVIMLFFVVPAEATHYRYGNVSWSRVNDASRTVTFTMTSAWRRSFFSPTPNVGSTVSVGTFLFGDGGSQTLNLTVTSVNATEDWFVGVATLVHTYAGTATNFTAYFESCCRLSTLKNNNDLGFRAQTSVQLVSGNTGSPVSTMPAIINLPIGQTAAAFSVPAYDPDGQTLTYALAPSTSVTQTGTTPLCQNPAGLAINPSTGAATFYTVDKSIGQLWNGFFVITDASGATTIVDFIMKMVEANTPPIFDYSVTPSNNHVFSINPGQNLTFGIKASCPDAGSTVTLTAVGLPTTNFTFSPALPVTANPVTSTFSFTPAISQLGVYVITFTATRNGGAQTSTSVIINVNTNPIFVAPTPTEGTTYMIPTGVLHNDVIVAANPNPTVNTRINSATIPAGASVLPSVPTAYATSPTTTLSWTPSAADFGPNSVTFTALDVNGRTSSRSYILWPNSLPEFTSVPVVSGAECALYSYDITVQDPDAPYGDVIEINTVSALPAWLTLTDNGDGTASLTGTPGPGDAGTYTIDLIVEDLWHHAHADVIQSFVLTIDPDMLAPVPDEALLPDITGECSASVLAPPTATDNCAGTVFGTTTDPLSYSAQGSYIITWTFDDGHNTTTQTQVVIVDDVTAPVPDVAVLPDVTAECSVLVPAPTATDNCAGTVTGTTADPTSFSTEGTYLIHWSYDDGNGNISSQDQTVIIDDVTAPIPDIATLPDAAGECSVSVSAPTATDNCTGTVTASTTDPVYYSVQGTYVVTWKYDDGNGNVAVQTQTVIVHDASAPVPDLASLPVVTGDCSVSVTAPTATDNCAGIVVATTSDPTSYSSQGTYLITWKYDDGHGNSAVQTQSVVVHDATPPVASCKNFTLTLTGGSGSITAADVNNGSYDNCGIASISVSPSTFTCANAGQNTVTLTVKDFAGNISTCQSTVTIQYQPFCSITAVPGPGPNTGAPSTTIYLGYGPQKVTLSSSVTGGSGFTYSWSGLSAASTALLSCTTCASPVFSPTSEGRYQYTLTATNSNGCSSACSITICVMDVRVAGSNGSKVYLCHVPPGNPNNPQTLSISVNAVPAHIGLHAGDHLGTCSQSCESLGIKAGEELGELVVSDHTSFETVVFPNPFMTDFSVTVETESLEPITLTIYDLTGKLVQTETGVTPNSPYRVSNNLGDGFYVLQVRQGSDVQNIKIVKHR
jgi:hypothetical protein